MPARLSCLPDDAAPGLAVGLGGLGINLVDLARALCGPGARRQRARAACTSAHGRAGVEHRASPSRSPPGTSPTFCAARRRRTMRRLTVSPSRPAPLTAIATPGRSVLTANTIARLGRPAGQWRRARACRPRRRRRRFCSMPSPASAAIMRSFRNPPTRLSRRRQHSAAAAAAIARHHAPKTVAAKSQALKMVYPPNGARVDLGLPRRAASDLALKAEGGVPPFRWMVNGAPVGAPDLRRQSAMDAGRRGFCAHLGDGCEGAVGQRARAAAVIILRIIRAHRHRRPFHDLGLQRAELFADQLQRLRSQQKMQRRLWHS